MFNVPFNSTKLYLSDKNYHNKYTFKSFFFIVPFSSWPRRNSTLLAFNVQRSSRVPELAYLINSALQLLPQTPSRQRPFINSAIHCLLRVWTLLDNHSGHPTPQTIPFIKLSAVLWFRSVTIEENRIIIATFSIHSPNVRPQKYTLGAYQQHQQQQQQHKAPLPPRAICDNEWHNLSSALMNIYSGCWTMNGVVLVKRIYTVFARNGAAT